MLWFPGMHCAGYTNDYDEYPIIPSGTTITNNGTWAKSDLGNNQSVLVFNGSSNYISLASSTFNAASGDWSIALWLKQSSLGINSAIIASSNWNSGGNDYDFYIMTNSSNKLGADIWPYGGSRVSTFTLTYPDTNWNHIVFSRSSSYLYIYLNGTSSITPLAITGSVWDGTFLVGKDSWEYNSGNIKDLMVWKDRALSQAEITLLMRRTHPITGKGLMVNPYNYGRNV